MWFAAGACSTTAAVAQLRQSFGASVSRAGVLPEALAAQEQAAPDEDSPVPHQDAEAEAEGQAKARNHQPQGPFICFLILRHLWMCIYLCVGVDGRSCHVPFWTEK